MSIARQLVERLSADAAQKVFGISLSQLSPGSKRDVQLRFLNSLGRYLDNGGSYTVLSRNYLATVDVIDKRAEKLLKDVNDILDLDFLTES